jgi:hypothetical protein
MRSPRFSYALAVVLFCATGMAQAPLPVGEVYAAEAGNGGSLQLTATGSLVMSGSSVRAGEMMAMVRLVRGGEVWICPRTNVSMSRSGYDLMVGMGTGTIETHYRLADSADSILTPDFRILLAGPGVFDFAMSSDAQGNTCVQSLGNGASIIVSELMGDGSYQVRAREQVMFRGGSVKNASQVPTGNCGCPIALPVMRAENPAPVPAANPPAKDPVAPKMATAAPRQAPTAGEVHIQVDAPLYYNAAPIRVEPPIIARITIDSLPKLPDATVVLPPPAPAVSDQQQAEAKPPQQKKHGLFIRLLAALFR